MNYLKSNLIYFSGKVNIYALAKKTNTNQTTLNGIINGTVTNPKINNLMIIIEELKELKLINSLDELFYIDLSK